MAEFRPVNLAEIYGQVDAAKANQAQMQNNAMMRERQRRQFALEDEELNKKRRISEAYKNSIDVVDGAPVLNRKKLSQFLLQEDPTAALEMEDKFAQIDATKAKTQAESAKAELENRKATAAYLRDRLAGVRDQATYDAVMSEAAELGAGFIKGAPREFNPEFVRNQLFTADEFLKQSTPKYEKVDLGGKIQIIDVNPLTNPNVKGMNLTKTQTPDSIASTRQQELNRAVTVRGQNMTDARAREATAKKVAPNEKLTEGMRSTGQYAARMIAAEKLLENTKEQAPGIGEKIAGALGETSANLARSPDRQKALQAQRDWVRAKLRKESGAAIGVDEMNNEILTYFPQIGDSKAVIEQKKLAREQAIQGMIDASGGAYNEPKKPAGNKPAKNMTDVMSEADKILGL